MLKTIDYKVTIIGKSGAGKTCLAERFAKGTYCEQRSTIGAALITQSLLTKNGVARLVIWDTGGMERYANLVSAYYRDADMVLIVYDITDMQSFDCVPTWLGRVKRFGDPQLIVLVGTKCDLNDGRTITTETALDFANQHGLDYIEVSAKTGTNVEKLFVDAVAKLKKLQTEDQTITLSPGERKKKCNVC